MRSANGKLHLVVGASLMAMTMATVPSVAQANDTINEAQERAIVGRVLDADGSPLPGARISIAEGNADATTNLQGEFVLVAPAVDSVTLTANYLGRPTLTQTVALTGFTTVVTLSMGSDTEGADVVVVGSLLDNTARALNQQRAADNTVTVISSDAIGRFPDPNIAEALQRASGIGIQRDQGEGRYVNIRGAPAEFSSVSVDGVAIGAPDPSTRAVDLDTIPSDIVSNLEVTKTLLPSQEADSISGSINIQTRSPFDARGFSFAGDLGASYNQMGGTSDVRGSARISDRFGPDSQFGFLLSGSYSRTNREVDNFENVWEYVERPEGDEILGVVETLFKDYDTHRERISGTGVLEWRPEPGTRVYLRGSYSRFKDDEFRNRLGILWTDGDLQPGATETAATFNRARVEKQFRHRVQVNEIYTATAGAEFKLGAGTMAYDVSYTRSDQTYPQRSELLYRSTLRPNLSYDFTNPDRPDYSLFESGEHLNLAAYGFRENVFRSNDTRNEEWAFGTRMEIPSMLGDMPITYSAGGRYRDRQIEADEERLRDRNASATPAGTIADYLTSTESFNYDYFLGQKFDPDLVGEYLDRARPASGRRIPQSITADYSAREKLLGMFGMARLDAGPADIVLGVRLESTNFRGTAPTYNETPDPSLTDEDRIGIGRASSNYLHWFPNLTVRYALTDDLIARFAATRGINRPNYRDVVPRTVENTESATTRVTLGNPGLRPTLSNNLDAGLEYYVRPLGLISVNGFYKDLTDYRYTLTRSGQYLGNDAVLTRAENAPDGRLYGFELNWQQTFSFLPGFLGNFGVFANYTWTDARIELAEAYAGRQIMPLPGQSRHTFNVSGFYEAGPFNARLSYTKRSDYLNEINAEFPELDLYWEGRGQLDFTTSFEVSRNIELYGQAKNLTNSPGVRYYGSRERVYEYEKFGYTLFGGVRIRF